jgi:hypothetical protein
MARRPRRALGPDEMLAARGKQKLVWRAQRSLMPTLSSSGT